MNITSRLQKDIRDAAFTLLLGLVLSLSIGIFLFDLHLAVYSNAQKEIFTNRQNLIPLLQNSIFIFAGLTMAVFLLGFRLKQNHSSPLLSEIKRQAQTLAPLVFLAYGRYLSGKAFRLLFDVPLLPLFMIIVFTSVLYFNLKLHFGLNPFRRQFLLLKQNPARRRKTALSVLVFILLILFLHHQAGRGDFRRFTVFKNFGGDEPRYLRLAYSLAEDGDIDVSNNSIVSPDEDIEKIKKELLDSGTRKFGHFSIIGLDEGIYHTHMPGMAVLILPGFFLDNLLYPVVPERAPPNLNFLPLKMYFTRLTLLILAVSVLLLLSRLLFRLFKSLFLSGILLFLFAFNSPFPNFSLKLYPEVAAAFFSLLALNAILFPFRSRRLNFILIFLSISFIPWLSQRLIALSLGIYLAFALHVILTRENFKKILLLSSFLFLSSLSYFYYFYSITGNPLPNSMAKMLGYHAARLNTLPLGFFGNIFHWSKGMTWLYPWTILALIGIYWGFRRDIKRAAVIFTAFISYYLMASASIPWHGMVKEPARYITSLFPLLLLFCAYTLISFYKRPSFAQLILYAAFFFIVFLHLKYNFLAFNFDISYVSHSDFITILRCTGLLAFLFLSTFLIDKWSEKKVDIIPFDFFHKLPGKIKPALRRKTSFSFFRSPGNAAVLILIVIQLVYILFFLTHWNRKEMARSFFTVLDKMNESREFQIWKRDAPSRVFQKNESRFYKIFKNAYGFQTEREQSPQSISLNNPLFFERVPPGCYRVSMELNRLLPENASVRMDYFGKTKTLNFKNSSRSSDQFLVFKSAFLDSQMRIEFMNPLIDRREGKIVISPIPCAVYGDQLIVRPRRKSKLLKRNGKAGFILPLVINLKEVPKKHALSLYLLNPPEENSPQLLFSSEKHFINKREKINLSFKLPPDIPKNKAELALMIKDEKNRVLVCRSTLYKTTRDYWILPKKQSKKITRK